MLKIEHTEVFGWEAAVRGLRNPMNSWDRSDSYWTHVEDVDTLETAKYEFFVGENDLKVMKNLVKAGSDHRKFMRMIAVSVDIVAPLYWWKEFDTYKVGTVANSCSTMHKIHDKEFTVDDFSHEHLLGIEEYPFTLKFESGVEAFTSSAMGCLEIVVSVLNWFRKMFLETKDKRYWWQMIQILPSSYNQRRTVMLNYETLRNIYNARKNHKLDCWIHFCNWVETLPYAKELICDVG